MLKLTRLSLGRIAHHHCKEPEREFNCGDDGQAEIDDIFFWTQSDYKPTHDIQAFKQVKTQTLSRKEETKCTWQWGNVYNSTCPHHYVLNIDPNRRPQTIYEAKCNCNLNQRCLNDIPGSRCKPVKYFITVLRKNGRRNHCDTYAKTVEEITVGCTCTFPFEYRGDIRYLTPE